MGKKGRDGQNWYIYVRNNPLGFVDPTGLFYYSANGQKSTNDFRQTTAYVIRNNDGTGNEFNASLYIQKKDAYCNTTWSKPYQVGANCKEASNGTIGSTTPDGTYYLSDNSTNKTPLYKQSDGTTDSTTYDNVLSLRTVDKNLTKEQRDVINEGDRLLHADQYKGSTTAYNSTCTPGGAGCMNLPE